MEKFQWPRGAQAGMKVYSQDHPQRKPTEKWFENNVRETIAGVRRGQYEYANLWLVIASIQNLTDPTVTAGFHTWFWAIEAVLGEETCKEIGARVIEEMGFTLEEGASLQEKYRLSQAKKYELKESATWDEIHAERDRRLEADMRSRENY